MPVSRNSGTQQSSAEPEQIHTGGAALPAGNFLLTARPRLPIRPARHTDERPSGQPEWGVALHRLAELCCVPGLRETGTTRPPG